MTDQGTGRVAEQLTEQPAEDVVSWRPSNAATQAVLVGGLALGVGLVSGRADVALVAVPLLVTAAAALRRPLPQVSRGKAVRAQVPALVEQGVGVEVTVDLDVPRAQLVAVRLPRGEDVPLGRAVVVAGGRRRLRCRSTAWGRGRVVLARADWAALGDDGVVTAGPVQAPEAAALALPYVERLRPGPMPPRPSGFAGAHRTRRAGDGSDLVDVRLFRPGDRLRRVDWRATARRSPAVDALYVRQTTVDADADLLLYVDTRVEVGRDAATWAAPPGRDAAGRTVPGSSLELAVRAALAIAAAQLRLGDRVGLVDLASRRTWLRAGTGTRQLMALRLRLAEVRSVPDARAVVLRPDRVAPGAVVVLLSPLLDDAPVTVALDASRHGAYVVVIDVLPRPVQPERGRPFAAEALELVLADQARRRERLQAAGLLVVPWEPAVVAAELARWTRRRVRPPVGGRL